MEIRNLSSPSDGMMSSLFDYLVVMPYVLQELVLQRCMTWGGELSLHESEVPEEVKSQVGFRVSILQRSVGPKKLLPASRSKRYQPCRLWLCKFKKLTGCFQYISFFPAIKSVVGS